MFNKNKETSGKQASGINVISRGTKITGDLISEGDFRIDGTLEGTLKTDGRVIIGKHGFISGKIICKNADVSGKFSGELNATHILSAKATSNISGDVIVGQIATEPGATFNATCSMKGTVKELTKEVNDEAIKQKTA